jgi:hypothetical protein
MISLTPITLKDFESSNSDLIVFSFEDAGLAGAASLPASVKTDLINHLKKERFNGRLKEIVRLDLAAWGRSRRVYVVGRTVRSRSHSHPA